MEYRRTKIIATLGPQCSDQKSAQALVEMGVNCFRINLSHGTETEKKSYFEINFSTIIKVNDEIKEKKELEKIILCDVQTEIYPVIEKSLLDLLHNSGYPSVKFEKKIDFEKLYNQRFN